MKQLLVNNTIPAGYKSIYDAIASGPKTYNELYNSDKIENKAHLRVRLSNMCIVGIIESRSIRRSGRDGLRGPYVQYHILMPGIQFRDHNELQTTTRKRSRAELFNALKNCSEEVGILTATTFGDFLDVSRERGRQLADAAVKFGMISVVPQHYELKLDWQDKK